MEGHEADVTQQETHDLATSEREGHKGGALAGEFLRAVTIFLSTVLGGTR